MREVLIKETGLVTKVEGNVAWVNTENKLACSSCKVESTCGNGILEKYLAGKVFISKLDNSLQARVGDKVEIAIPSSSVTKASLIAYSLPLFALIFGALLGDYWFDKEIYAVIFSALGLFIGLKITHGYNRRLANQSQYVPKMVSKVSTSYASEPFESIQVKNID